MISNTDVIDDVICYEAGGMDSRETLKFFSKLIRTGMAWNLQGSYGKTAQELIECGWIASDGMILKENY